jgi:predicted ATPase
MNKIQTNWCVITGGPSSGKSKTLDHLAFRGYLVIPEAARILIDNELSKGNTVKQLRSNELNFQEKVLEMKIEAENRLNVDQLIFLERGIADSIPYYKLAGGDSESLKDASTKRIYKKIFLLDQVAFEEDYARTEDSETADKINVLLYETYSNLGYEVIRVPIMTIEERVNFLLTKIDI